MSLFSKLFGGKKKVEDHHLLDAKVCPSCWGRQEYDNKFIDYVEDRTKDNINHNKSHQKAFIQQFVETHVEGIHLKQEGEYFSCPHCNLKHKHTHNKPS